MSTHVNHDFKTPRPEAGGRLPTSFMVIPILTYLTILFGGWTFVSAYTKMRSAAQQRDEYQSMLAQQQADQAKLEEMCDNINLEKQRAQKLAQWVEGTRVLQPISAAINRAVPVETTLAELLMERSLDLPAQINLNVRINKGNAADVIRIQSAINSLSYRAYNTQQLKNGETLEFRSMLVWAQQ